MTGCRHPQDEGCERCGVDPYSGDPILQAAETLRAAGWAVIPPGAAADGGVGVERHTFAPGSITPNVCPDRLCPANAGGRHIH